MSKQFGNLNVNGEDLPLSRDNVTLYKHLGAHAVYDHLFITVGEDKGLYVWNYHSQYQELAARAVKAEAVLHLNITEPSRCDVEALLDHTTADLHNTDTFPEQWLQSGTSE